MRCPRSLTCRGRRAYLHPVARAGLARASRDEPGYQRAVQRELRELLGPGAPRRPQRQHDRGGHARAGRSRPCLRRRGPPLQCRRHRHAARRLGERVRRDARHDALRIRPQWLLRAHRPALAAPQGLRGTRQRPGDRAEAAGASARGQCRLSWWCHSSLLLYPGLLGWLCGVLATQRTRDEPLLRPGSNGRLRCGPWGLAEAAYSRGLAHGRWST